MIIRVEQGKGGKDRNVMLSPSLLEGRQDMGGKQDGQAGMLKPPPRPRAAKSDEDVVPKRYKSRR